MPFPPTVRAPRVPALAAAVVLFTLSVSACAAPEPAATSPASAATHSQGPALPSAHIHGLAVNPDTGQVLLATHDGLFDATKRPAAKIGGTNDLMGFTPGKEQGVFYASGHPGEGSSLPNPLGLIRSRDGGKTWELLSRQGESDFHALTSTTSGIVAYDGTLRVSPDGKAWTSVKAAFAPAVLAGHPDSDTVLATTGDGVQRSTDGGATWTLNSAAPVIQFAGFASPGEAAGIEPDGTVHVSADGGATWTRTGRVDGGVQAMSVVKGQKGKPWIWAATDSGIVVSTDGGATFRPADAD